MIVFRCEFAVRNPNGCQSNQYYTSIEPVPTVPGSQLVTEAPTEPWKVFIQTREQFGCAGKTSYEKFDVIHLFVYRQTRWILCKSLV